MGYTVETFSEAEHELVKAFLAEQDVPLTGEGKPVGSGFKKWTLHFGDYQKPELIHFLRQYQHLLPRPMIFLRHRILSARRP